MSKAKHTTGPWRVVAYHVASESQKAVATCKPDSPNDPIQRPIDESECMANARLIAAAPDMKACLETILAWLKPEDPAGQQWICSDALHPTDDDKSIVDYIEESIAKAEGK